MHCGPINNKLVRCLSYNFYKFNYIFLYLLPRIML